MKCKPLEIFFSKTAHQNSWILHTNSLLLCAIKVCSNSGTVHLHYWGNNSQRNMNIANLMQTFENHLLNNY